MSVGMLLKGEYIKTSKRFAFVVTALFLAAVVVIERGSDYLQAPKPGRVKPGLPEAWTQIMSGPAQMSMFFGAVLIMLLVAAEFSWRTARQNVIDGMSKRQWFISKLLLMLAICMLFQLIVLGIGAAFAATQPITAFVRPIDVRMMAAYTLCIAGFTSVAFMLAITVRSAGPALGVFLLWTSLIENLVPIILEKIHKGWGHAGAYFPVTLFGDMLESPNWDPARYAQVAALAQKMGRSLPEPVDLTPFVWAGIGYVILFVAVSYLSFMKRDL